MSRAQPPNGEDDLPNPLVPAQSPGVNQGRIRKGARAMINGGQQESGDLSRLRDIWRRFSPKRLLPCLIALSTSMGLLLASTVRERLNFEMGSVVCHRVDDRLGDDTAGAVVCSAPEDGQDDVTTAKPLVELVRSAAASDLPRGELEAGRTVSPVYHFFRRKCPSPGRITTPRDGGQPY